MPGYEEVAGLPVSSLLTDDDSAAQAGIDISLRDLASTVLETPSHAVVLKDQDRIAGLITETDLTRVLGIGTPPDARASDVIATLGNPSVVSVDQNVTLQQIPDLIGNMSRIVVTSGAGEVCATLKREDLAQRIRDRFVDHSA